MSINTKLIDAILTAMTEGFAQYPYETKAGVVVEGTRPADLVSCLRDAGWRNVSRMDADDFKEMGFTIIKAQYVGGVRKTGKFCEVVTL